MRPKYAKVDANQKENIAGLIALGFVVWDISSVGGEVSDLMIWGYDAVAGCERWLAAEDKVPGGKLTPKQRGFLERHPKAGIRFETVEDVLRAFGRLREDDAEIVPELPNSHERAAAVVAVWQASGGECPQLEDLQRLIALMIRTAVAEERAKR